ncbi:MAG: hypothetical protein ACRDP7_38545 [Trebonia sp.]
MPGAGGRPARRPGPRCADTNSAREKLGLHYQTTLLVVHDASANMGLTCGIEVWLPSIVIWKEVSSASWSCGY